jgi:hypothetical protein
MIKVNNLNIIFSANKALGNLFIIYVFFIPPTFFFVGYLFQIRKNMEILERVFKASESEFT